MMLFAVSALRAQDLVVFLSGKTVQAKVLEVSPNTVKYKMFSNPDGPDYLAYTEDLRYITYANGETDRFNEPEHRYNVINYHVDYRDIRDYYNPSAYIPEPGDPYSRVAAGVASFFIPGLGQCIDEEWGRGLGIFLGYNAWSAVNLLGLSAFGFAADSMNYGWITPGGTLLLLSAAAQLGFGIWNICDAVRIAKVKNMYFQDSAAYSSVSVKLEPNLALVPSGAGTFQPAAGLSLKLNF